MRFVPSRDAIRRSKDRPREWVATPEWTDEGTDPEAAAATGVYVATMTGTKREKYEQSIDARTDEEGDLDTRNLRAVVAVLTCEDELGEPVFQEADIDWLTEEKSSTVLDRIFKTAMRLNALRKVDQEAAAKN